MFYRWCLFTKGRKNIYREELGRDTLAQGHPDSAAMLGKRIPNFWFPTSGYFVCLCTLPIIEHTIVRVDLTPASFFITPLHHSWHKPKCLHWIHAYRPVIDSQCIPIFNIWSTDKSLTTYSLAKPMPKLAAMPHVTPRTALPLWLLPSHAGQVRSRDPTVSLWAHLVHQEPG